MEPFKNLFNEQFVSLLASHIKKYDNRFQEKSYILHVLETLETLELKQRMRLISSAIDDFLPLDYKQSLEVLKKVKTHFSYEESMSLQAMVLQDFVEVYGLDDFESSIQALEVFTIESSSEFAVRHFIIKYEEQTMKKMLEFTQSQNEHLRRFASEGCRPRLPWAIALPKYKKNPCKVFEILEQLKEDESKYVQKSVANNLNDISKDNPDLVLNFVANNLGKNTNCDWILKHGSRTLLKQGNKEILSLFGFAKYSHVRVDNFIVDDMVKEGEILHFGFELNSDEKLGNLRIEYAIDFVKANGKQSRKIFMISQSHIKTSNKKVSKKYSFKPITTRKYYLGTHRLSIIVNGVELKSKEFILN
jgi:3-methyladenine DNA glycosylase AlkC